MKSVMTHAFSQVPTVNIERSTFDRSHGYKTTFDAPYLIPFLVDEALPGDTYRVNMTGFARLATPLYPLMDNMRLETFFFAVPYRILWDNWVKLCGEKVNPTDTTDYTVPTIELLNAQNETIYDYLGLPTKVNAGLNINALPLRAYAMIWNSWFRDENLQDSITVPTGNGPDPMNTYTLLKRGKRHDYFTSALPWTQKGNETLMSLGTSAPVTGIGKDYAYQTFPESNIHVRETIQQGASVSNPTYTTAALIDGGTNDHKFYIQQDPRAGYEGWPNIRVDLTQAVGPSVNEFREAVQVQRILERDARAGTRYCELLQSHFGVTSPLDAVLQRPEYLGGGSTPVHITPVANTSNTGTGKLAATGVAAFRGHGFVKSFTEFSIIIGLLNVRCDITYQQGLDRMWSRRTRFDHYLPSLAHLGEQAILNQEIYVSATDINDGTYDSVFGYQERFAEYRYKQSRITGKFRSNDATPLDAWHLGLTFADTPALNATFIEDAPPIDRVIAVPSEPHFIFDSYIDMQCTRPMPVYSVPGLVDHF